MEQDPPFNKSKKVRGMSREFILVLHVHTKNEASYIPLFNFRVFKFKMLINGISLESKQTNFETKIQVTKNSTVMELSYSIS